MQKNISKPSSASPADLASDIQRTGSNGPGDSANEPLPKEISSLLQRSYMNALKPDILLINKLFE